MSDRSRSIERVLWIAAAALIGTSVGIVAWKTMPGVRSSATYLARQVGALGANSVLGRQVDGQPPSSGPVRLRVHQGDDDGGNAWLAPNAHGPDLSILNGLKPNAEQRRWTWEDVNTVPIVRWEGDSRVVKPGAKGRQYGVRAKIDVERARAMELAFGYQIDRAVIHYRTDDELMDKRASLDNVLLAHGVVRQHESDGDVLAPDYDWMIKASTKEVQPLARAIVDEARRRGAQDVREEFGALASFVQQLEYGEAPNPGDSKHRFGLSMPLWALATNRGDCDTRAVLLVALCRSIKLCDVELVRDANHQHMLAAAAIPVRKGDHLVRPNGRALVLVETTDDWPVGRVANRTIKETLQTLFLASGTSVASKASTAPGGNGAGTAVATQAPGQAPSQAPARMEPGVVRRGAKSSPAPQAQR